MYSIFVKEINSFFSSVVGYVAVIVFLMACGFILWVVPQTSILDYGYATLDKYFELAPWLLMFLIPAVTMRAFPDEFRSGTIEWLSTKPLTSLQIIMGKYLAVLLLVGFALFPTLIYVYTIGNLSVIAHNLDTGGIIGSYVGLGFMAATFASIGLFCSSLTSNQIVGFLVAVFACYLLYTGFDALSKIPAFYAGADYYLAMIGLSFHYNSISRGIIDTRDVVYFLSVIILFISLTQLSLNRRTWDTAKQG
ncbi:MAG: gliding motility-associated ABC transporter permease subunit GldF [Chitinophagaceae bacterium]|uniref:Gliding motility-associated ABC transporter permease subunit GldF n=1 Tax=Rurimicrobium arvi TaxID=2049916 RepID=A0ABP8MZH5_9BACT